jgi:para-nitrobenzyl esterase
VVVSINYRLGRLGLFAHPALTKAKEGALGNYAFMDQLAALKWIKQNIAAFGGNPNQITIMGESAGGISVIHHLTSKKAKGLFQRAIVLSGGGRTFLKEKSLSEAEESGIFFADSMGIKDGDPDALKALRSLTAEQATGDINMLSLITKPETFVGGVIVDGEVVDDLPEQHFRNGNFSKIPLLIGTTSNDLGVIPTPSVKPLNWFGSLEQQASNLYNKNGNLNPLEVWMLMSQDITMHEQARFAARQFQKSRQPVWLYRFDYVADSFRSRSKGAEHASELPYLFGTVDFRYKTLTTDRDRQMSKLFQQYLINFIKTGKPNAHSLPKWDIYQSMKDKLMMFDTEGAAMREDPLAGRLNLVEQVQSAYKKE